jgi:hypothetical protein
MGEAADLINKRMREIETFHTSFEIKMGLGTLVAQNEVNRYLTMSQVEIRKLSAEECGEAAIVLCQEAAFLQNVQYTPFSYRRELAIRQNERATELDTAMRKSVLIVETLEYMPTRLRHLSSTFEGLQQTKRGMRA